MRDRARRGKLRLAPKGATGGLVSDSTRTAALKMLLELGIGAPAVWQGPLRATDKRLVEQLNAGRETPEALRNIGLAGDDAAGCCIRILAIR